MVYPVEADVGAEALSGGVVLYERVKECVRAETVNETGSICSGPLALVTMPPMSSLSMATAWSVRCCACDPAKTPDRTTRIQAAFTRKLRIRLRPNDAFLSVAGCLAKRAASVCPKLR